MILDRYEAVLDALRDERWSSDRSRSPAFRRGAAARGADLHGMQSLLVLDPPAHTRVRKIVNRGFTQRQVARLEAEIEGRAEALLGAVDASDIFDVVAKLARPLPARVIAGLLGAPEEDCPRFQAWSDDLTAALLAPPDAEAQRRHGRARDALGRYLLERVAERRREPRDDLLSLLVARRDEDGALDDAELLALCRLLLVAGHETTTNLISAGLGLLLSDAEAWELVARDALDLELAVEELARLVCPIRAVARVALEDIEVEGRKVSRGEMVTLSLADANRDRSVFEGPDTLDLRRDPNPHLAFGNGVHFCLGAALARLETRVVLRSLARRFPALQLAEDSLRWRRSSLISGLTALPVRAAGS